MQDEPKLSSRNPLEPEMKEFDFETSQWFPLLAHKMKVQILKSWTDLAKLNLEYLNRFFFLFKALKWLIFL